MQDHVHRASQPNMNGVRPMAIIFVFKDGYVHAVQTRQQAKAVQDSSIISSSASKRSNPVDKFELLTLNNQLNSSQGHVASPMYDKHSPVNNQSVVPQSLTTAPMYNRHSPINNEWVVPKGVTAAPMYDTHSPVNNQSVVPKGVTTASRHDKQPSIDIFGLSVSPTYNLPVTCTTNPPTMRLSISDNSLNSDAEDHSQWLITLQNEQEAKIQEWDKKMKQEWQKIFDKFQQEWTEHVLKERNKLIEQLDAELNEEKHMVNVVKGSLIKCDPAVKQYLVYLDETLAFGEKFILHNLDEQHLFVQTSAVPMIKEKLQEQIDKISYDSAQTK
ncbi:unnamed protein product [Rotaria sp. Silwood1]|nr:unnamed protein product [Rotaria sp. Silwood1]